eukprot:scaffold10861_cov180-Amphora_coffeaeformis.AAC.41
MLDGTTRSRKATQNADLLTMKSNQHFVVYGILASMFVATTSGFGIHLFATTSSLSSPTALAASTRRKKESMAEKRARRNSRQQREINLPKRSKKVVLVDETSADAASPPSPPPPEQLQAETAATSDTMTKAQQLIERQRRSVAMLTLVRERIEEIPADEVAKAFADQGYYVVDNFLDDEETLQELQREAIALLDNGMTPDMENLASGEYVGPVKGGEEQYVICPRSVEWIVSMTKHFGTMVVPEMNVDSGNCLGRMRTFDRQAFDAAKKLLTEDDTAVDEALESTKAPFQCLVDSSDTTDQRRLSLRYYLLPSEWKFGGGIEFESNGLIEATRDRLLVWKSAETPTRGQPWKGDESHRFGSCIELDLVQTAPQQLGTSH